MTALLALAPPVPAPPERRDGVRMLVSSRGSGAHEHRVFGELPGVLRPGDLVVVNTSATRPAAVPTADGRLLVHLSTERPGGVWTVELRLPTGHGSAAHFPTTAPARLRLAGGATVDLLAPFAAAPDGGTRLWTALLDLPEPLPAYLRRHGRPIRYGTPPEAWPLDAYQTIFAAEPGSAEMPSAGRPFTPELLVDLAVRGVGIAPITLHTGVSSQEAGEPPYAERYDVPASTAERLNAAHAHGHRVVAVGTTTTRALETVADRSGHVHPGSGWTDLVITADRGVGVVDGLLTGWHEAGASHLQLLEAVGGPDLVRGAYDLARNAGYRWHEFGDVHLILP